MTQREREWLDSDPLDDLDAHSLIFGDDDDDIDVAPVRLTRSDRRRSEQARRKGRRRRGRLVVVLTLLIVVAVGVFVVPRVVDHFKVPDYVGVGTGSVAITVRANDTASDIGQTLKDNNVVKSTKAFTNAASSNAKSTSIQPGQYELHRHMSGKAAIDALLDPTSRNAASDVLIPEGATSLDVTARLTKLYGSAKAGEIQRALSSSADLGVPVTYKIGSRFPTSIEGFEFPATYTFDPSDVPNVALSKMVSRFITQDRATGFATAAEKLKLTPYQALIVASMAQSEAIFPADMPKVVRTILNRIAAGRDLQFDSTSSYGCKLQHIDAAHCIYSKLDSPYNTYLNKGLPPTPIDNPGAAAMQAAVHPAAGNWLYFVNMDKAGHLFFTNDEKLFAKAAKKCIDNHWCG